MFSRFYTKLKDLYTIHKKLFLLLSAFIVLVILLLPFLFISSPTNNKNPQPSIAPFTPTSSQGSKSYNPLISNGELERVRNAYKKKLGNKYSEAPKYQYKYELSPNLKSKKSSSLIQSVLAAEDCNLDSMPDKVSVFSLKSHLFKNEAIEISKEFNFSAEPSSLPMEDGASFQYYFTDPEYTAFLTITEPSGIYYYHKVLDSDNESDIDLAKANDISDNELKKHKIFSNLNLKNKKYDESLKKFVFDYVKEPDSIKTVDPLTIKAVGMSGSVCDVKASDKMNKIETIITQKGGIFKILNNTRKVDKSYAFNRQSLENSISEYEFSQPIDPIVVGPITEIGGKVIIEQATLVYFDYGDQYAQISYVPMYLTSGKGPSGARVFNLFPAITKADLDKTNINDLASSQNSLQLGTFKPAAPKPKAKMPPPLEGCYGNLIDYRVTCSYNGETVCDKFFAVSSEKDPFNVCEEGCKDLSGEVNTSSDDPCAEFLEQQGIQDPGKVIPVNPAIQSNKAYSCILNGCPC